MTFNTEEALCLNSLNQMSKFSKLFQFFFSQSKKKKINRGYRQTDISQIIKNQYK